MVNLSAECSKFHSGVRTVKNQLHTTTKRTLRILTTPQDREQRSKPRHTLTAVQGG
ncbi:hypothetical protein TcasGA2_TC000488 [Tribolium castaneum]|uniref:Uncharacterized protein n=1 Tax=Tribolium castaneum TaxID=7070 RepID=A0A139WMK7_TRICA|nr:hypothetical protein TcasGA2_TC000488 [Tribolium castaneum]